MTTEYYGTVFNSKQTAKLAKVKQQLAIAVEALEKIKKMTSPPCYIPDFEQQYIWASLSLQQIEELEN